jgi:hypothetical protein
MSNNLFEYKFKDESLDKQGSEVINSYIANGIKSNPWYKNFPVYVTSLEKNYISHWKSLVSKFRQNIISQEDIENEFFPNRGNPGLATVKKCPGISDLLAKSLVITAPCEMYIEVRNKEISSTHVIANKLVTLDWHPTSQYQREGNNTFDDVLNIKFVFPILFRMNSYVCLFPPTYHNPKANFEVACGVINEKYTRIHDLNVSIFIDASEDKDIHIKEGQALGYFWNQNSIKIKHNPDLNDLRLKTRFNSNNRNLL